MEIAYDTSKDSSFSSEEVVIDVPLTFDKSLIKVESKIEAPSPYAFLLIFYVFSPIYLFSYLCVMCRIS